MLQNLFRNMSPVVKNLLILNVLFFVAQFALPGIMKSLELYPASSDAFEPWQLATHFFMHSTDSLMHIFFNMFALVIFGVQLEKVWGPKKFLIYYIATALGAAFLHLLINYLRLETLIAESPVEYFELVKDKGLDLILSKQNWENQTLGELNSLLNTPMLGASGAVFGLLAAYGYLFPNTELYLMFIPVPVKAKYFVMGYAAIELFSGISNNPNDNVAHFAHLGGALVGIIMVIIWQRQKNQFY